MYLFKKRALTLLNSVVDFQVSAAMFLTVTQVAFEYAFAYVQNLDFNEEPNYDLLIRWFRSAIETTLPFKSLTT